MTSIAPPSAGFLSLCRDPYKLERQQVKIHTVLEFLGLDSGSASNVSFCQHAPETKQVTAHVTVSTIHIGDRTLVAAVWSQPWQSQAFGKLTN